MNLILALFLSFGVFLPYTPNGCVRHDTTLETVWFDGEDFFGNVSTGDPCVHVKWRVLYSGPGCNDRCWTERSELPYGTDVNFLVQRIHEWPGFYRENFVIQFVSEWGGSFEVTRYPP